MHQSLVRNAATRLFEEIDVDGNHVLDTEEFLGILREKGFSLSPLATAEILEAEAIACGIDNADDGKIIMNKVSLKNWHQPLLAAPQTDSFGSAARFFLAAGLL